MERLLNFTFQFIDSVHVMYVAYFSLCAYLLAYLQNRDTWAGDEQERRSRGASDYSSTTKEREDSYQGNQGTCIIMYCRLYVTRYF